MEIGSTRLGRRLASCVIGGAGLALASLPASADQAACEADARAAMLDVDHSMPMRQNVTTETGENTIEGAALTTPGRRGMALDANDNPVSLWIDGRFYSSTDAGATWSLVSEQSQEDLDAQAENRRTQAESATGIVCDYGIELDGRSVNRFEAQYLLVGSGIPVKSQYWIDASTRFPWRVVHEFGGAAPAVITQNNEPMPDLTIADPES